MEYGGEEEKLTTKELVLTMGFALVLTVALFIVLPAYLLRFVQAHISSNVVLNVVEGLIKISFFIAYIAGIAWMDDIKRVFAYHGAEHKAINCYESGQELTVDNVAKHSRIHARCGTNFLLVVMFTSVFIFSLFGRPPFSSGFYPCSDYAVGCSVSELIPKRARKTAILFSAGWPNRVCCCST